MNTNECNEGLHAKIKYTMLSTMVYSTLVIVGLSLLTIIFWMLYPYKVIEYSPDPYSLRTGNVYRQGDPLVYEFDYVKYTSISPTVTRAFVDGITFNAPAESLSLLKGEGHAVIETRVPNTLPPGEYVLRTTKAFQMNPIRTITITNETESFKVIANE